MSSAGKKSIFALIACLALASCPTATSPIPEAVDLPIASPSGGRLSDASVVVNLSCPTAGAIIYYTDDGTAPTEASNRYTVSFRLFGSTVVIKAIAVKGSAKSAVMTSTFVLNDGKAANALGIVKGVVSIPSDATTVLPESIKVFAKEVPERIVRCDRSGFFMFDGLDTMQTYTFYFTNQDVGPIQGSRKLEAKALSVPGGVITIAKQLASVQPAAGTGLNLGEVLLKKTGKIKGKALLHGRTGDLFSDHTGIDAYVPGTSFAGKTNAEGVFELWFVPEGNYTVRAERAGYTFADRRSVAVVADQETDISTELLNIYFGLGTVTGSARSSDGSADAGSSAGITVLLKNLVDPTSTFNTVTSADGSYTITNVEPGSYTAFFNKDGYLGQAVEGVSVEGAKITKVAAATLPALGGKISGRAPVRGESDLGGTIVVAKNEANGKTFSTGTSADGSWTLDPVLSGTYTLTASRSGFTTRTIAGLTLVLSGSLSDIAFTELVPATGTITGKAILEGAATFEGISATLRKSDDATVSLSATTDTQGTCIFTGVKPGTYLLIFAKDGFLSGEGASVSLLSDGVVQAPAVVLKTSKARLAGTATLESRADHAGVAVLATGDNGKSYTTITDATGRWALTGMEAGTYTVQATLDGYTASRSDPVLLGAGANIDAIAMKLTVSSRSVFGKALLEGSTLHSGTKITATMLGDTQKIYSALTNDEGYFVLAGMTPGSYIASFSHENYKGQTSNTIALAASSSFTIPDITLAKARGGIGGLVKLQGRTNNSAIKVSLVGTVYEASTDASGAYGFQVPSGNYPGGVRFELADFETTADTGTITVLTDSTYGVPTHTINATHNAVSGKVDLAGTADDSGIAVGVDGYPELAATTLADGSWAIAHVPLGNYTFRFTRANTPDVTSAVAVVPADAISLGKLDMIPNASSLKGYIKLSGMSDHSGIKVTVTTEGAGDLSATTNSAGYFEIGNILSTGSHAVSAAKTGWVSWGTTISDFNPLEVRSIGVSPEIALLDTAAPVIASVVINGGALYTSDKNVSVAITATEQGSGIDMMRLQLNGSPATPNWEPYIGLFSKDLSSFYNYTGNGAWTLTVTLKDKSGNVSAPASGSITVTNNLTTIKGVLSETDPTAPLHWTKAMSPIRVEGNILVPAGKTLVVDPGVEVRFAKDYYIQIEGSISAQGTQAENIIFDKSSDATSSWLGFKIAGTSPVVSLGAQNAYSGGNIFKYCRIGGATSVFSLLASMTGYYCAYLSGCAISSPIGNIGTWSAFGSSNGIVAEACAFNGTLPFGIVSNSTVANFSGSAGTALGTWNNVLVDNIDLTTASLSLVGRFTNVTLRNHAGPIGFKGIGKGMLFENVAGKITISNDSASLGSGSSLRYSQFSNVGGIATDSARSTTMTSIDLSYNYFGPAWTQELDLKGSASNLSFIADYYDDFSLVELNTAGYLPGALANVGYGGAAMVDVDAGGAVMGSTAYIGAKVLSASAGARIRTASDFSALSSAAWQGYAGSQAVNLGAAPTGREVVYWAQVEDAAGNQSVPLRVSCPVFDMVGVTGGSSTGMPYLVWSVSSYRIGKTEVTQRQWQAVMGSNPSYTLNNDLALEKPVDTVGWLACVEFANRLSWITGKTPAYSYSGYGTDPASWPSGWRKSMGNIISMDPTAKGYRLPTAAEWEWAARGGTSSASFTYSGGNTAEDVAWISANSGGKSHLVGQKAANELGLYDMSGNLWEWCWDWSGGAITGANPVGPATGSYKIYRGGCFSSDESAVRNANSGSSAGPSDMYGTWTVGLRIAQSAP